NTKVDLERQLARKVDDSKAENDQFLIKFNHLRTQLENLKEKSVETKFEKPSILGKPPADKLLINSQILKSCFVPKGSVRVVRLVRVNGWFGCRGSWWEGRLMVDRFGGAGGVVTVEMASKFTLTPSGSYGDGDKGSLDYGNANMEQILEKMEYQVGSLMKDAISLVEKSENLCGIMSNDAGYLSPEPPHQEALEGLVMNFILNQEEKVRQLEECMRIVKDDFVQLSLEVVEKFLGRDKNEGAQSKSISKDLENHKWELFCTTSGNFFWQWEHITGSRKTALEVGMDQIFNSQQSSLKLDAASAIKFLELNALKTGSQIRDLKKAKEQET
nr:hypothetical protein [Tanacetum cinerariifolium]